MTVPQLKQEQLPQNRSLLNRRCKNALGLLKVGVDPTYLYSIQLASLALEREWYRPMGQELELTIHGMSGWNQENAQKFLEQNSAGDPIELAPKPRMSPQDLAAAILSEVEDKLSQRSGSTYPTQWKGYQLRD